MCGTEASLDECPFSGWRLHECRHYEDAGVVCEGIESLEFFLCKKYVPQYLEVCNGGITYFLCIVNIFGSLVIDKPLQGCLLKRLLRACDGMSEVAYVG